MSDRIKNAFDDLLHNMEEAPSWDQVTSARVSDTPRFNRGLAFAGGVAGVLVLGLSLIHI